MELKEFLAEYEDDIIRTRRHLHEHPEVSLHEAQTSSLIRQEIEALGLPYESAGNYGIVALLEGGKWQDGGRTVALRADMDALPMQESPENLIQAKTCCSQVDGAAHLCGHDCHIAMMLAVMKALFSQKESLRGRFLFCFESAEEIGEGFKPMLPMLEKYQVDCCYAVHVWPSMPAGKVSVIDGPVMAAVGAFEYTIVGKGTHGARPQESIDPILCACEIVTQLNALIARERAPVEPCSLTVGHIEGGTQRNIIPDSVSFGGTMRFFNRERGEYLYGRMEQMIDGIAQAYRCTAKHTFKYLSYPLINDASLAKLARETIRSKLGADYLGEIEVQTGSDGYVNYIRACGGKGIYGMLGVGNPQLGCGEVAHNPKFDVDESALAPGAFSTMQIALALLNREDSAVQA